MENYNGNTILEEKISVIVPIYNVEKYLKRCLDSIINQTYKNLEIILVDDGSIDSSGAICDEYGIKEKRIIVIHKKNGGLSDARNEGIKKASGKYIAFIDSDDYINEQMLEILMKNLRKYKADISICAFEKVYDETKIVKKNNNNITCYNKKESLKELLNYNKKISNHAWNKLYKIELFKNICYPKDRAFEDIGTTYKLFDMSNTIVYSDFVGYYYYQNELGITGNISKEKLKDAIYLINERYNYLLKKYPNLEEILLRDRANQALWYCVGLAKIKDKKEYNSTNTIDEYKFFIEYINRNGIKNILEDNSKTYKCFAILLKFNRSIFYWIVSNLFKVKRILKKF